MQSHRQGWDKHAHVAKGAAAEADNHDQHVKQIVSPGVAREEGFLLCPEGAATYAAYKQALADGRIRRDERAVLFNCATGLKYPLPPMHRTLDRRQPIDYAAL